MEVRQPRRANAILRSASACLSRRSLSARRAGLPVHRGQEGGARGLADLHHAQRGRCADRPEHLTHARRSRPPSARSLRDEALKAEISRAHKDQLLGAGGWRDARDAGPTRGRRASRCRSWPGAPPVRLMADLGLPRRQARQVPAHHAQRAAGAVPGRPRQKAFQRFQAERAVGRRHSPTAWEVLECVVFLGQGEFFFP